MNTLWVEKGFCAFFGLTMKCELVFLEVIVLYSIFFFFFFPLILHAIFIFLDASSHLYMRVCPSVRVSVRPSVYPSVNIKEKPPKKTISACETHRITRPGLLASSFTNIFIVRINLFPLELLSLNVLLMT